MEEENKNFGPANKSEVKIEASHCWNCGDNFSKSGKTKHHSIPKAMKPDRNVLIPVCRDCHDKIHHSMLRTPKLTEYENFVKGIKTFIASHEKKLKKVLD